MSRLDGLLLTGSRSNIEPTRYGGAPDPAGEPDEDDPRDLKRDAMTLPLIRAAVAADLPVLAICRGCQELNVALGGTLYPRVHELDGRIDHRSRHIPLEGRYEYVAHPVHFTPGAVSGAADRRRRGDGQFAALAGHRPGGAGSRDRGRGARRHRSRRCGIAAPVSSSASNGTRNIGCWRMTFSRALFAAWGAACRAYSGAADAPQRGDQRRFFRGIEIAADMILVGAHALASVRATTRARRC